MKAARLFALAALVGLAAPVQAQNPKSTDDTVGRGAQGLIDGAKAIKKTSACVYARSPGYVATFLASRPGSHDENVVFERIAKVMENCLDSLNPAIRINATQTRGALAEARYLSEHPVAPDFATITHPQVKIPADWTETTLSKSDTIEVLKRDFANCVVAKDPTLADAMLRTDPQTAEEAAAGGRLMPDLGPCLQSGITFKLDYAILRALTAEALDRSTPLWVGGAPATNSQQ